MFYAPTHPSATSSGMPSATLPFCNFAIINIAISDTALHNRSTIALT
jgi:hypothetical protein